MARVPRLTGREVLPSTATTVLDSGVSSDAFGGGLAKGLVRIGDRVQEVGENTLKFALKQKQEDDERELQKLDVEFSSFLRTLTYGDGERPGFLSSRGENAVQGFSSAEQAIAAKKAELAEAASNPQVAEAFGRSAEKRSATTTTNLLRHVTQEREAANIAVKNARLKEAADDAAAAMGDPRIMARSLVITEDTARREAERQGKDELGIQSDVENARSKMIEKVMANIIASGTYEQANNFWQQHKGMTDGVLRADIQARVNAKLREEVAAEERREREAERELKRTRDQAASQLTTQIIQGQATAQDVVTLAQKGMLNATQQRTAISFLKNMEEVTTDEQVHINMKARVLTGDVTMQEVMTTQGISKKDRIALMDQLRSVTKDGGPLAAFEVKRQAAFIKTAIAGVKPLVDLTNNEKLRLAGATEAFYNRVTEGQDPVSAREAVMKNFSGDEWTTDDRFAGAGRSKYWTGNYRGSKATLTKNLAKAWNQFQQEAPNLSEAERRIQRKRLLEYKRIIEGIN